MTNPSPEATPLGSSPRTNLHPPRTDGCPACTRRNIPPHRTDYNPADYACHYACVCGAVWWTGWAYEAPGVGA